MLTGFSVSITAWFVIFILIAFSVFKAFSVDNESKSLMWLFTVFGLSALLVVDVGFIWYFSLNI